MVNQKWYLKNKIVMRLSSFSEERDGGVERYSLIGTALNRKVPMGYQRWKGRGLVLLRQQHPQIPQALHERIYQQQGSIHLRRWTA